MKIPKHLEKFDWYAGHLAWLDSIGYSILYAHNGAVAKRADLRGADLSGAVLSGAVLSGAVLSGAVLRGADLSGADLSGAVLSGAVLRGADLSGAVLRDADLSGADLSGAVLRGAVLSGAVLPTKLIVPDLDKRMLEACSAPNALEMGTWHTCKTTHCRAGWAITLAGPAGRVMEDLLGPATAGALIYAASVPDRKIPDFYASNEAAMADIKACATPSEARP